MRTALKTTTARDLMQTEVITLPSDAPVREAVELFEDEHITGAPVVDAAGIPVGFLTIHDVARSEHLKGSRFETERGDDTLSEPFGEELGEGTQANEEFYGRDDYSSTLLDEERVKDWMTRNVIAVAPDESLGGLCRLMVERSIHRVLVVDEAGVLGIVTTFDVVRHLAETL
jgi:CBS domain-containing protein